MKHSTMINGIPVTVDICCTNPELVNNTCPLNGDCRNCEWCKVTMNCSDFWAVKEKGEN